MEIVVLTSGSEVHGIRRCENADISEMNEWYAAHGFKNVTSKDLPGVGFFVKGMAAGFLCQTDASIGFLDGFIGNPKADKVLRDGAIEKIIVCLEDEARRLGIPTLVAITSHEGIMRRAVNHGFRHVATKEFYTKEIG